jgi:hypothetical protein
MLDNLSIQYSTKTAPLLTEVRGVPGLMASSDFTIIRLFTKIPGDQIASVFSKVMFLSKETFNHWKTHEVLIISEKFESVDYRTDRFVNGLEAIESYMANRTLDIDDRDTISKIRNFIVNSSPTSEKLKIFIADSIEILKNIIMADDETGDFDKISGFFFSPPNPEDELTDFILLEDQVLEKLDNEFAKIDISFTKPIDEDTFITLFDSLADRDAFFTNITSVNGIFTQYQSQKKKRIIELINSNFFKRQLDENTLQASETTPTAKIIRTIEDETKICNECGQETSSKFCQNVSCKSISPMATLYSLPSGENINILVSGYTSIAAPYTSLSTLSNANKQNAIAIYARDFSDLLSYNLLESETSLSICTKNVASHKINPESDLRSPTNNKTAISPNADDIKGQKVYFWDYFRSGSDIYAIIQHEDEIKTPVLVQEVRDSFSKRKRSFNIDINEDYFKNTVLYIVSDMYGQIKTCREGIIDTSNPDRILLLLSTNKYADTIRLIPTATRPLISDLIYVPLASPENYNFKDKGRHLLAMLNLEDMTSSELAEKSEEYRFSRRFFYRLSKGHIIYESSNTLYKLTNHKIPQKISSGSIDKIRYTRLKEAIGIKSFVKEQGNMYLQFLKNLMFSPGKSANIFYANYLVHRRKKTTDFKKFIFEKNSLIDCIYTNKPNRLLLSQQSQVTKNSNSTQDKYKVNYLEAYKMEMCTPFFLDELHTQPIVNDIVFTLHYNQGNTKNPKLNSLLEFHPSFNNNISDFMPINISLSKDKVVTKQLLQNGLNQSTQEDLFTVSLSIHLSSDIDFYELTLFEKYLSENGVFTQNQTTESLQISIRVGDLISFII